MASVVLSEAEKLYIVHGIQVVDDDDDDDGGGCLAGGPASLGRRGGGSLHPGEREVIRASSDRPGRACGWW